MIDGIDIGDGEREPMNGNGVGGPIDRMRSDRRQRLMFHVWEFPGRVGSSVRISPSRSGLRPNNRAQASIRRARRSRRALRRSSPEQPKMAKKKKVDRSDSDEDETLYYRYSSGAPPQPSGGGGGGGRDQKPPGSGGLAPSKSTLYVSNLDFSLTNSDLHTLFSTFGKVARVTVLKDRAKRQSRGVAFVQFVAPADARRAVAEMHGKLLNGRKVAASIAIDNGRAPEFIKKRVYQDKSRCYECGEGGHLSYECPKNLLGPRERPPPKKGRRGGGGGGGVGSSVGGGGDGDGEGGDERFEEDNWASVVDDGANQRLLRMDAEDREKGKGKKEKKKSSYFSDESDEED